MNILIGFAIFAVFLLKDILIMPGLLNGEDQAFPATINQAHKLLEIGYYTWDFNHLVPYRNYMTGAALTIQSIQYLFSQVGIVELFPKLFLVFLFTLCGYSMFWLLRQFGVGVPCSILAGLFYITSPPFFNYTIMGWHFVLFALGLWPFAIGYFIKAIGTNSAKYAVIAGVFYALAFIQSQAAIWYLISFFIVMFVLGKNSIFAQLKLLLITMTTFFLLNCHVILPLLLFREKAVEGTDYVNAIASLGMSAHYYPLNIVRLWGSLFNYQYETIIIQYGLEPLSFVAPIFIFLFFYFSKDEQKLRKYGMIFLILTLVPLAVYALGEFRWVLQYIPYSNLIRDFARFTVFTVLSYSVLFGMTLQLITQKIGYKS